jgi:probable rRNA maturation factor
MLVQVHSSRDPEPLALDAFERLGAFVLRMEEAPDEVELSVALVSEEEMAGLNRQYRGTEGPTDVLSFGCDDPCPTGPGEAVTLGDVVIAPDVALAQAAEFGTTAEAELNLLLVHGVLHLLGYDHDTDEGAAAMQAREQVLLTAWADTVE